jgi:hypothetical protein
VDDYLRTKAGTHADSFEGDERAVFLRLCGVTILPAARVAQVLREVVAQTADRPLTLRSRVDVLFALGTARLWAEEKADPATATPPKPAGTG